MTLFDTIYDAGEQYKQAKQTTSSGMFEESDVAAQACSAEQKEHWQRMHPELTDEDLTDKKILRQIGTISKSGKSTLYARLLVGRVFPPDLVIPDLFPHGVRDLPEENDIYWSHYLECARLWSEDTPHLPYEWLNKAILEGWSVRRLKAAIKKEGPGKEPPTTQAVYILDNTPVTVDYWDRIQMTVVFDEGFSPPVDQDGRVVFPQEGWRVILTAVREASVTENVTEGANHSLTKPAL